MRQHFFFNFLLYRRINGPPWWLSGKESVYDARDPDSIPGLGRCLGGEHGNPLQFSSLESPMGRGAWQGTVDRVQSRTRPKQLRSAAWPINNVVIASGTQWRDSATRIHVSILPSTTPASRLPHNTEQSPLCWTAGPCWWSMLNVAVCPCPSQTP